MIDAIARDLRYGLRWLRRSPGFTAVAILSLGLGVGVNTAMFSLVDAVMLRPLPVADPGSLVDVFTSSGDGDVHATSSFLDLQDFRARNSSFTDMIGYSPMMAAVSLGDRSRLLVGQLVTANYFQVLGVGPERGRLLEPGDDQPGADRVVVLSHRMWVGEFASDDGIVGRALTVRGQSYRIVGVAPARFTGVIPLLVPQLWLPVSHADDVEPAGMVDSTPGPGSTRVDRRGYRFMFAKGRLKPGVTAAQASANLKAIGTQLESEFPQTNRDRRVSAVPTADVRLLVPEASGPVTAGSAGVMAVVGLVLLIACANVGGLLAARASGRRREMSVRAALGAGRLRLVRQLLVEGVVIGLAGVVVAIGIAWSLIRVLLAIKLPIPDLPLDLRFDARVMAFALVVATAAGLAASLLPSLQASSPSLIADLRGAGLQATSRRRRWRLREWLVAAQVALTIVLLVVASLLLRSLSKSQAANVGFDPRRLAVVSVDTSMVRYSAERSRQFWDRALARVRALPGVEIAALASPRVPFDLNFQTNEFRIDDRRYAAEQRGEILNNVSVSADYFATLGVPIIQGRALTESDREGAARVVVINQTMAQRYWPGQSAIGRTITLAGSGQQYEIVGVSADYRVRSVSEGPTPYVHMSAAQRPATYNYLIARARTDGEAVLQSMRRELLALEPGLVFIGNGTMERTLAATLLPSRVGAMLATGFGALGVLLAGIGLYGVMAFVVSQRTREIGIRLALGARAGQVVRMVLGRAMVVVAAGAAAGAVLAALAAGALGAALYGIGSGDPLAWIAAMLTMTAAAALAGALPALRAVRVDPARALRAE
ncbi:MAG TPA: ABC transporter permease [Vicinamibacterales bacterium]|nr:ABC transporter permease [Vicinamibacterales bacterium]